MDAGRFLDNFATVADAPGGVRRLRDLVLDLAVSGGLVSQRAAEGTGQTVVEQGAPAISYAVAQGWTRRRSVPEPSVQELPFRIPGNWSWVRLPAVTHGLGQVTPDREFTYLDVSSVNGEDGSLHGTPAVLAPDQAPSRARKAVRRGTVLYSTIRPYLRNVVHIDRDFEPPAIASTAFAVLCPVPGLDPRYLKYCVRSTYFSRFVESRQKGVAYPAINDGDLAFGLIPIPPPAEQERIVARVDELMELCDDLEARQERRHSATTRFRASALHAVTEAETPDEFRQAWRRVNANWAIATGDAAAISALRETVAQLAVEGRLASGVAEDQPAEAILEECHRRKAELVAAGGRSRSDLGPVSTDEVAFSLPRGWAVARLDRWCDIAGGLAKGRKIAGKPALHLPYLRVANVKAGYLALDEIKEIEVAVEEVERYSLLPGDVLLTEGGDWDKLGRSAMWTGEIEPCLHQNHVFRARALSAALRPEWIVLYTNSEAGRSYFQSKAKRTTNLASINMTELRSMPLPVPPAAEQVRILRVMENLTNQLTRLDGAISLRSKAAARLAAGLARMASP